ncbi:uncharacterized protein FFFS_15726 [Fusarium fujikuroi]|nr:uncharacterized protein FFFS_15726 [Fusarium fujikuroi]
MKETDLVEVCKVPADDTESSEEKAREEEHVQEKKDLIYLPFDNHLTITQFALNTERSRELLESVADIEDTTVKRIPIDWYKTAEFLDDAAKLTEVLQTKEYSDYIKRICMDIEMTIRDLRDQ